MKLYPISKVICFFFFFLIVSQGFSQNDPKSTLFVSLDYRHGENVPHREIIKNLRYPYRGVDFKIGWQTLGKKDWQQAFRYPSLGIGVNWCTFKTEILGEPFAAYFFTNFPQIATSWFRLDLEVDFGLSYGIHPYDKISNPNNFSTGSSLNSIFGLYLEQSFHILPQVDLFVCEGLCHYSNGALGWPNLGLNIPSLKFGVRAYNEAPDYIKSKVKPKYNRSFSVVTTLAGGTKKLFAPTPSYNELLISPTLFYRSGFKRRVGVGFEVAYNESVIGLDFERNFKVEELLTYAVHFSHEFIISRFTILSQFGIYLKNSPSDKFYYERIGFGYFLTKNLRVVFDVKAHYIKAEYLEFGLSYDLNLKH
jgi:hypothetical protein